MVKKRAYNRDKTLNMEKRITVRLSPRQQLVVDEICRQRGCTATAVIRAGIELLERMMDGQQ